MKPKELVLLLPDFLKYLEESERTLSTQLNYKREVEYFFKYAFTCKKIEKLTVIAYKEMLMKNFAPSTVNTKLAALNTFFSFIKEWELRVKPIRIQRKSFLDPEHYINRQEYMHLLEVAKKQPDKRVLPILITLSSMGLRVSELRHITVDTVKKGKLIIHNKGKFRTLLLPESLRRYLAHWCEQQSITEGVIFKGKHGLPFDRSLIWRKLKDLAKKADISPSKVYPHSLRRLFAVTFFEQEKDIAMLADILGHSSINTTRLYVMTSGDKHLKCMESLGLIPKDLS